MDGERHLLPNQADIEANINNAIKKLPVCGIFT